MAACAKNSRLLAPAGANSTNGSLDDLCRDAGPRPTNASLNTFQVGSGLISVDKEWFAEPRSNSHQLSLSLGVRGLIEVSHDLQQPWPRLFAPSGIECEIVRGADTVLIRGRIERGLSFSVEALWEKPGDHTQLYLRLTTGIPRELRSIRRTIENVQFPLADSVAAQGR